MILRADLSEHETSIYGERAAIRQWDGGQTKEAAEAGALQDIERIRERKEEGGLV